MDDKGRLIISFPNEDELYQGTLRQSNADDKETVSIVSFAGDVYHYQWSENQNLQFVELAAKSTDDYEYSRQEYVKLIHEAIQFCETDEMKVVCSRSKFIPHNKPDIWRWCRALKDAYPNAYVYVLQTDQLGCWIGASPELLVEKHGNAFSTHSLAGTKWGTDEFTEKEYREQLVVTKSILKDLYLDESKEYPPEEIVYGSVRHLKSSIQWTDNSSLNRLTHRLHPTPAVCGYPKEKAINFITNKERNNRKLYTGFISICGLGNREVAFVNLRCGRIFSDGVQLFAGGGINAMSDPETEWLETEQKIKTITNVLGIYDTN
ncbi:MAG: hypothetical protein Salg2KO_08630 [Salibacteraceae bacterium]